jgi:hypothetical protein
MVGRIPFFLVVLFVVLFGIVPHVVFADLATELADCRAEETVWQSPVCPSDYVSTDPECRKTCCRNYSAWFSNGCAKMEAFSAASEAGKSALCEKWKLDLADPATPNLIGLQYAYDKSDCDSREKQKAVNLVQATKLACEQYTKKVPMLGGAGGDQLCDPTCDAVNPACRCVLPSECDNLGKTGGATGVLAAKFDLSVTSLGDSAVARAQNALASAKTQKMSGTVIAAVEKYVKLAQDANAELKKMMIATGQSGASLAPLNDQEKKIEGYADAAEKLITVPVSEGSPTTITNPLGGVSLLGVLGNVIKVFLGTVGAIALMVFVYAGLMYLLSGGDPAMVTKAKDTMKYGAIGLIIIISAYAITSFFVNTLSG